MTVSGIVFRQADGNERSWRDGIKAGAIVGIGIWAWLVMLDAAAGQPFHTFETFGGLAPFTAMHCVVCVVYGVALFSAVPRIEQAPTVTGILFVGVIAFEGAFAVLTNVLSSTALGPVAWLGIFSASLLGAAIVASLLLRASPIPAYLGSIRSSWQNPRIEAPPGQPGHRW